MQLKSITIYFYLVLVIILPPVFADEVDDSQADSLVPTTQPVKALLSPLDQRMRSEDLTKWQKYVITPYKPNYILPIAYDSKQSQHDEQLGNMEVKFQISLRIPMADNLFGDNGYLSVGYTQVSYWQAYNKGISAAFRETNFEPEIMLTFRNDLGYLGVKNKLITFGLVHQSNGRSQPLSRSWNRIYIDFIFERENTYVSLKPWYRIPEDEKQDALDAGGDDNPNIEDYYGYGELSGFYKDNDFTYGLMLRNNFKRHDNRGAIQLDWTFPMHKKLLGFMQYFNGYGESLIDYDQRSNRLSVGIMLTNWL